MKTAEIFAAEPGTVILLVGEEEDLHETALGIAEALPASCRERAALNRSPMVSLEMIGERDPNSFHDLAMLCSRLITAAGRRSHFEGLLLLRISDLTEGGGDSDRLRALGEVLAAEDGPASQCVTVLWGPTEEAEVLRAADSLDFDGRLRIERCEPSGRGELLEDLLAGARLTCASEAAEDLLRRTLDGMRGERRFDPRRFLRSCAAAGLITEESIRAALDAPLSYINRLKKGETAGERTARSAPRRIGFGSRD
ncbi:MAG: hypothetical protein IJK28_01830 [Clostridia bacterium]|nr:hypothetical protein [Clostridia bacterium]